MLALTLLVGAAPLLRRYVDGQLAVVHGAVNNDNTITCLTSQTTNISDTYPAVSQINVNLNGTLNINSEADITMVNDSGRNDDSEIEAYGGATINLYGKITGSFDKLAISSVGGASFNIFLNKGAVFDVNIDHEGTLVNGHSGLTCYGCNYGCNEEGGTVVVKDENANLVENGSEDHPENATVNTFYIFDPGPVYTITATPKDGYSQVVWTKGPKGVVIEDVEEEIKDVNGDNVTYTMAEVIKNESENKVNIRLKENARYQVFATFIPDPKWEWDEDNNATLTVYSYAPNNEASDDYGILATTYDKDDGVQVTISGNTAVATFSPDGGTTNYTSEPRTVTGGTGEGGTGSNTGDNSKVYHFTDDSKWTWKQGSTDGMPVIVKKTVGDSEAIIDNLVSVSVDGTLLTRDVHYKAVAGSIKITLQPSYLKTLNTGQHKLTVKLTDATLENTFTIAAESGGSDTGKGSDSPKTADNNYIILVFAWLFIVSFSAAFSLIVWKRQTSRSYR